MVVLSAPQFCSFYFWIPGFLVFSFHCNKPLVLDPALPHLWICLCNSLFYIILKFGLVTVVLSSIESHSNIIGTDFFFKSHKIRDFSVCKFVNFCHFWHVKDVWDDWLLSKSRRGFWGKEQQSCKFPLLHICKSNIFATWWVLTGQIRIMTTNIKGCLIIQMRNITSNLRAN